MNHRNAMQIFKREVRDQLRDRRTLFIIVILPILLYPLLGMSMFQMVQFMQEQPTKVLVLGGQQMLDEVDGEEGAVRLFAVLEKPKSAGGPGESAPASPEKNESEKNENVTAEDIAPPEKIFAPALFPGDSEAARSQRARLLQLTFWDKNKELPEGTDPIEHAKQLVNTGKYDATLYFAPDFAERLEQFRKAYRKHGGQGDAEPQDGTSSQDEASSDLGPDGKMVEVPQPSIFYTTMNERSRITFSRLTSALHRWVIDVGRRNLAEAGLPSDVTRPFQIQCDDLAVKQGKSGIAIWAKLLPLMLLLWSLTGAFYPAIDLCAGEKERGTLETLLCSPAHRSEIVLGKLATVMVFSIATALLNIASVVLTGWFVISSIPMMDAKIGSPPWLAIVWLVLTLIPVAALFSAICVALAAFAKSSKEGQYYLMPVLLIVLPLAILPMAPSVELNLGTSLIPITNLCLLLRVLIEGQYMMALKFALPVVTVTLMGCLFAIRWAVEQFQHESVLFRESERLDLVLWLRHVFRDRYPTPTVAAATMAGVLILMLKFFMGTMLPPPTDFNGLARIVIITQITVILTPVLMMTLTFTTAWAKTLLLGRESWTSRLPMALLMAFGLAVFGHPLAIMFQHFIMKLYPLADQSGFAGLDKILASAPNFVTILLLFAVLPAVCEELAFRGFILSGFRHTGSKWRAIAMTAVLFGMTHAILQQWIITATIGLLIGYIAVQSGNLLVPIVYHVTHNSLAMCLTKLNEATIKNLTLFGGVGEWDSPVAKGFVYAVNQFMHYFIYWDPHGGPYYDWRLVIVAALLFLAILMGFSFFRYERTDEEQLRKEIERNQRLCE